MNYYYTNNLFDKMNWERREIPFNRISLTIVNDIIINWYSPLVFLRFCKSGTRKIIYRYFLYPLKTAKKVEEYTNQ